MSSLLNAVSVGVERGGALLLYASLEGALVIFLVWVVCRLAARGAPSLRCALWWTACLKLLTGLSGIVLLTLPLLPDTAPPTSSLLMSGPSPSSHDFSRATEPSLQVSWAALVSFPVIGIWVAGVLVGLIITARQMTKARAAIRRSSPVVDGRVSGLFSDLSRRVGLGRVPELRFSDEVRVPQVVGFLVPVVILPRDHLEGFTESDLAMSLCHELVHVRRKDLWLGWVPAMARRVFFFHPGAVMADHEYRVAREAACDAEVLRVLGGSAEGYGRLLLKMSVAPSGELTPSAAVASPFLDLRRRLLMLEQFRGPRRAGKLHVAAFAALALAILVPVRVGAGTSRSKDEPRYVEGRVNVQGHSERAYVFFLDDHTTTMNGSLKEDLPRAIAARGKSKAELLWFRLGEEAYIVRDARVLAAVRGLGADHSELDSGEDEAERKHEALEEKVDALSDQEEALSAKIRRLTHELDELRDERDDESEAEVDAADARRIERLTAEIRGLEDRRAKTQEAIESLAKDLEILSAEQERIEDENDRNSKIIDEKIYGLLLESIKTGLAEPVEN